MAEYQCPVCNKVIQVKPYELKTRRACSKECVSILKRSKWVTRNCEVCGKEFTICPSQAKRAGKVCSSSCAAKKARKIHNPPVFRRCLTCGKEFKARTELLKIGRAKYCSHKCRGPSVSERMSKERVERVTKKCIICDKEFVVPRWFHKQKTCSQKCNAMYAKSFCKYSSTSIERKIEGFLKTEGIDYIPQKRISHITITDFTIGKVCVFADGDYWHGTPERKVKDKMINEKLISMGYNVLRFTETEINKNFNLVETKLRNALGILK